MKERAIAQARIDRDAEALRPQVAFAWPGFAAEAEAETKFTYETLKILAKDDLGLLDVDGMTLPVFLPK